MRNLFRLAVRNVRRNTRRTALSVFAVFFGIAVMVSVRGFVNGLQGSIVRNVVHARLGAVQVHRAGYLVAIEAAPLTRDFAVTGDLVRRLRAVPGVTGAAPRIHFPAMVNLGETTAFALATAVEPAAEYAVCPEAARIVEAGAPLGPSAGILVSSQLADALGAKVGSRLALIANDRDGAMNGIEAPVTGIYTSRMPGLEKTVVLTLPEARALLRMEGRATEIALSLRDPDRAAEAAVAAAAAAGLGFEAHPWQVLARNISDVLSFQDTLLRIVSGIFLFVALVGIVNTMLMAVLERVREIGTMMAVGVTRRQILALFLMESGVLGLLGGLAGSAAGYAAVIAMHRRGFDLGVPGVEAANILRPEIGLPFLAVSVVLAVVGSVAAALYPAWRASRMRPVEALLHS